MKGIKIVDTPAGRWLMKEKGKGLLRLHKEMRTTRELVVPGPRPPDGCMLAKDVDSDGNKHVLMDMCDKQNKEEHESR